MDRLPCKCEGFTSDKLIDRVCSIPTSSVSAQGESNPGLWLATRVEKMELSCPLGTSRRVPREKKFPRSNKINSLSTNLVWSRWFNIGLVLSLRVYAPRLRLGPQTKQNKLVQYLAILTSHLANNKSLPGEKEKSLYVTNGTGTCSFYWLWWCCVVFIMYHLCTC